MKEYFDPNGRRVAWLLYEIERQTTDRLSDESRQHLLDEVACHLDAAIQARLELGMTVPEAEIEAVESFGAPKVYVDDLLKVHELGETPPRHRWYTLRGDRPTMITFGLVSVYACFWMLVGSRTSSVPAILGGVAAAIPIFAALSFKARRLQPAPLLVGSLAVCALMAIGFSFTWDNLWAHGGMGYIQSWDAEALKTRDQHAVSQLDAMLIPLENRAKLHAKYANLWSTVGPNMDEARELMEVPVAHGIPYHPGDGTTMFGWVPGPDARITFDMPAFVYPDGNRLWKDEGEPLLSALDGHRRELTHEVEAITAAQAASPLSNLPLSLVQCLGVAPFWFAFWGLINLICGSLGRLRLRAAAADRRRSA